MLRGEIEKEKQVENRILITTTFWFGYITNELILRLFHCWYHISNKL